MKKFKFKSFKNIFPCLLLSTLAGIFTGGIIFLFEILAGHVSEWSSQIFGMVRDNPQWLWALLLGAVVLGAISALTVKYLGNCKGGGIPTSIALLRGLMDFKWLRNLVVVFFSALVTYFGGIPLGNEGPSVQMGTAVGRGTMQIFAPKHKGWDRYIMTGGACAGFAAATLAPLTAILYAFEEAHRRFSSVIFISCATAVVASSATIETLGHVFDHNGRMFSVTSVPVLPIKYLYTAAIIGLVTGLCGALFTKFYSAVNTFFKIKLANISLYVKIPAVFLLTAVICFCISGVAGSGRSLIETLFTGNAVWYMVFALLCLRAIMLIVANNIGITGGLFVPTLAFGGMIGFLCGKGMVAINMLPKEHLCLAVIIGIVAFLASASRTPLMAMTFSLEALGGMTNIIPIGLGIAVSYITIELSGLLSFTDSVLENKVKAYERGEETKIIDLAVNVREKSFAVGKEIREILWPPTCVVTSMHKKSNKKAHGGVIEAGDILYLHYTTTKPEHTLKTLETLVGEQPDVTYQKFEVISSDQLVPEN